MTTRMGKAKRPRKPNASPEKQDAQVQFLVMSIMSAVTDMVQAKCSTLTTGEQKTLRRHIEKAIKAFIGGK